MNKDELKDVLCGTRQVKYGTHIQAAAHYLRGSQSTSTMAKKTKCFKEEERERELSRPKKGLQLFCQFDY